MKYLLIILGLYGAYWYVAKHYEFHDTLAYAKSHPGASWAPTADYYVGLVYYQRGDFPNASEAFTQLLTDYATSQYRERALFYNEDAAENNKNWDAARTLAQQYIEDFPNGKDIELARKRLELINYHHGESPQ